MKLFWHEINFNIQNKHDSNKSEGQTGLSDNKTHDKEGENNGNYWMLVLFHDKVEARHFRDYLV